MSVTLFGALGASKELIIFHAGSLSVPIKAMVDAFKNENPGVTVYLEAAGSRECARKITDLKKPCDVMASADYSVITTLLIPDYADWNIKFAGNEMAIVYTPKSKRAGEITRDNWFEILKDKDILFGRADPNSDPCGYRAVLTIKLAEKYYNKPGLTDILLKKNTEYIRPKETDLLAFLETNAIDFIFLYRSVALQHDLKYLILPDEINLKKAEFAQFYKSVSVDLTGKEPGATITQVGEPMIYGVTIPRSAPNTELAKKFIIFMLSKEKGMAIMEREGQPSLVPASEETFNKIPAELKQFALPRK